MSTSTRLAQSRFAAHLDLYCTSTSSFVRPRLLSYLLAVSPRAHTHVAYTQGPLEVKLVSN